MVMFYTIQLSHLQLQPAEIYIHTKQDNGTNIDRPLTYWNLLPHFQKTEGLNFLTNCPNK